MDVAEIIKAKIADLDKKLEEHNKLVKVRAKYQRALMSLTGDILLQRHRWKDLEIEQLRQLNDQGLKNSEIAEHFGLSVKSIQQVKWRYGIRKA